MEVFNAEHKLSKAYIDDSKKPDFKVIWKNRQTNETGTSTFFIYEYGVDIIKSIFETLYPGRKILQIESVNA